MKKWILLLFVTCAFQVSFSQVTKVLFIGNSYTYVNNLPQLFADVALSHGDTVVVDSYTPGGYTLELHSADPNTIAKIYAQQWDYVVVQEQSQRPSFSPAQVAVEVLPYATAIDSMIHDNNPCTETVFYMTWGRKNGDASNCAAYPPVCTYEGMQARLRESYILMAQQNNSTVSPVGAAWKHTRDQNPVFDLYQPDESHPSLYGSYLAACTFYATIFHRSPSGTTFLSTLPAADAAFLQDMAAQTVTDSLSVWYQYGNIPVADFSYSANGATVQFQDQSMHASTWFWTFGDQTTSVLPSPLHTYAAAGTYPVTLKVETGCKSDLLTQTVTVSLTALPESGPSSCARIYYDAGSAMLIAECMPESGNLRVFAPDGKLIRSIAVRGNSLRLPVTFPSEGVYVVEWVSGSKLIRRAIPVF